LITLSNEQRRILVEAARAAVVATVAGTALPRLALAGLPTSSGVFVTVRIGGTLRGCLGTLDDDCILDQEVVRCAAEAASVDPRFPPVTPAELDTLTLDISVLGPLERIDPHAPAAFVIGKHGLVVEKGRSRGLLLPQVAVEWAWTPERFLQQTCIKAGLSPHAWRVDARVYRFSADVFGD
jgi:AmmeMemoRadiSam system protein A